MEAKEKLRTPVATTWCPGCSNFGILESMKRALASLMSQGAKQEDFAMVTGIGCHGKIFDYLNISGIYGLHGRVLPTALGIKLGNPKLKVIGFSGDGDAYAEGLGHFVHTMRYNPSLIYIVHDNQTFSLTTGQSTPTSKKGFKSKSEPFGYFHNSINPIQLALISGATFIARCNPLDIESTSKIIEEAIQHNGFSFIEMIQNCLIFNNNIQETNEKMYKIEKNYERSRAEQLAKEWDYSSKTGKIPIGVIYQESQPTLENKLAELKKSASG